MNGKYTTCIQSEIMDEDLRLAEVQEIPSPTLPPSIQQERAWQKLWTHLLIAPGDDPPTSEPEMVVASSIVAGSNI